jgi:hypothetical protein
MIRQSLVVASLLSLAACATAGSDRRELSLRANPSDVIATELAFARAAREKGTWTAFRDYATKDAQWPGPRFESVQAALKGVPNPAQAIVWEPDQVWASCDGTFALSSGPATHPGGKRSRFATIWQRQNNGEYRWVIDQGFDLEDSYAAPEMISARMADCPAGRTFQSRRNPDARRTAAWSSGQSDDGTLAWTTDMRADCSRTLVVSIKKDGEMREVFRRTSSPPPAPANGPAASC